MCCKQLVAYIIVAAAAVAAGVAAIATSLQISTYFDLSLTICDVMRCDA